MTPTAARQKSNNNERVGLWLIGAGGGVGCTVALGLAAWQEGLADQTGLVTALPPFAGCGLVDPASLVFGGHEIRGESLLDAVRGLHQRANIFDAAIVQHCAGRLKAMNRNLRPGTARGAGAVIGRLVDRPASMPERSDAAVCERLIADLRSFQRRHKLARVVVVHVASSEPPPKSSAAHRTYDKLHRALGRDGAGVLPASSLYALAAIEAGCAYVNFTPSTGIDLPALRERADAAGTCYMGRDGKTGETLVKSALAPMFAMRHLKVLSWVGQNILGNRDGSVLKDPRTRAAKIRSKDQTVTRLVAGSPTTHVGIDFVPSLDDWKVAWDFVHFEGFLNTKMSMQFTWQGCDSILAAPLVIDLARLAEREARRGRSGPMHHLAFFFKEPMGDVPYDLSSQWRMLLDAVGGDETKSSKQPAGRRGSKRDS